MFHTTNLPKYYSEKLILTYACLFYKLCHPLLRDLFFNTTWSVATNSVLFAHRPCCAWQKQQMYIVCQKLACALITGYEYHDL